jgi:putative photosynthetic complex assembly protein
MSYIHIAGDDTAPASVPKPALWLAFSLALATIGLAGAARLTHSGLLGERSTASAVASRSLVFSDRPDGSIGVYDVAHGVALPALPGGNGGFVRGALRALARQRRLAHVGPEVPFTLVRWSDGRLTLDDSATHNHLELQAFGPSNEAAFAALLSR